MEQQREQRRFVAEKTSRIIKPPPRQFRSLTPEGSVESRGIAQRLRIAEGEGAAEARRGWQADVLPTAEGYLRLSIAPLDAATREPQPLPPSWAVVDPPPPPGQAGEAELPSWNLEHSGTLRFGELSLSPAGSHPEALQLLLRSPSGSELYGLGERMGRIERSGRVWEMWNTDEPEHLPTRDPLYVCIPYLLIAGQERWYGFFLDNPGRQYWDTAADSPGEVRIDLEAAYVDAWFFSGETPWEVLSRYTRLTGRSPLPPRWALGFHQSRYSYYPASRVVELAERFRREALPADVIHLDIDYMEGYRVMTWDRERFPEPAQLARELLAKGIRLVTIVDPGVKIDSAYPLYREGRAQDCFCKRPGGRIYEGRVWPGPAVYPDFSRRRVRSWWARHHDLLLEAGIGGIWNDMNEPADFTGDPDHRPDYTVPNDLVAEHDGTPMSFHHFHNLYANAMNMATREAFRRHRPGERGFVLSRSGYAGVQRSSAVWTGDNCSWWEHLAAAVPMLLGLSLSGVPFIGSDTGGFQEDASPELYARWIAFSAFTPLFRAHSADDTGPHEPWSFGPKVLDIARHYLRLRYSLLPYLYTAFEESCRSGEPPMRPLFHEWPRDRRLRHIGDTYLFGPALLVAPVTAPDTLYRHLYLPPGRWFDLWEDRGLEGEQDILAPAPLERLPLFVRAGTIIPREAPRLSTEEPREELLILEIYPDSSGSASGCLYEDAGEGHAHRNGTYNRTAFHYSDGNLRVEPLHAGMPLPWRRLRLRIHSSAGGAYDYAPRGDEALASGAARLPAPFCEGSSDVAEYVRPLESGAITL